MLYLLFFKIESPKLLLNYVNRDNLLYSITTEGDPSSIIRWKISFVTDTSAMQVRCGELVQVLAARDGSDALAAARRGPTVHVHRRGNRRLHPVALSLRRRPLRSGADRAETGLFSRVSSRHRFVEG